MWATTPRLEHSDRNPDEHSRNAPFVMTTFLLVRHCLFDGVGRYLAGRAPGQLLNAVGRAQLRDLGARVAGLRLDAVFSSPLERTRETAAVFAGCIDGDIEYADELLEVDCG